MVTPSRGAIPLSRSMSNSPNGGSGRRLYGYVGAIVALGVTAFILAATTHWPGVEPPVSASGVLTFILVGLGLELGWHRLRLGSAYGSIAFVTFLGAALVFGPAWGSAVTAVCLTSNLALNRRPPLRVLFNVAQYVLAIVAGSFAYLTLGGVIPPGSLNSAAWPFVAFVLVFFLINSGAVSGVIALSEERPFVEVWIRNTWSLAAYDIVASGLGLAIALLYLRFGFLGVGAVVIPILFMRHIYAVNVQLQETQRELLDLMVKAIEARDPYTSGHSQRVAQLAGALARDLHLGLKEVERISTAALLHDVGKIYEEFAPILRKEGRLTPEEKLVMQTHPVRSAELVGTITSLHGYVYKCVRHHHENYDGSGYPDGLVARQIPIGARIIMVADTMDAMTTDRPYRRALPFERVVEELNKYAGKQFDPFVLEAFHRSSHVRRLIEQRVSQPAGPQASRPERVAQLALR